MDADYISELIDTPYQNYKMELINKLFVVTYISGALFFASWFWLVAISH